MGRGPTRISRAGSMVVDRAGFEPAALRSRVSAFPHFGSLATCHTNHLRPANDAAYQADLPAHEKARTIVGLLNWFAWFAPEQETWILKSCCCRTIATPM